MPRRLRWGVLVLLVMQRKEVGCVFYSYAKAYNSKPSRGESPSRIGGGPLNPSAFTTLAPLWPSHGQPDKSSQGSFHSIRHESTCKYLFHTKSTTYFLSSDDFRNNETLVDHAVSINPTHLYLMLNYFFHLKLSRDSSSTSNVATVMRLSFLQSLTTRGQTWLVMRLLARLLW